MTFVFDPFLCFISMTLLFDLFRCFYDSLLWPVSLIHSFVLMTPYFVYFLWPVPLFLWLLTLTRFFYPFLYFVSMTPVFDPFLYFYDSLHCQVSLTLTLTFDSFALTLFLWFFSEFVMWEDSPFPAGKTCVRRMPSSWSGSSTCSPRVWNSWRWSSSRHSDCRRCFPSSQVLLNNVYRKYSPCLTVPLSSLYG